MCYRITVRETSNELLVIASVKYWFKIGWTSEIRVYGQVKNLFKRGSNISILKLSVSMANLKISVTSLKKILLVVLSIAIIKM